MITVFGAGLAIIGSIISIAGALINNLLRDHYTAMKLWMISNVLLLTWAIGSYAGYWNGGLSMIALMVMYGIFTVSNFVGLKDYVR